MNYQFSLFMHGTHIRFNIQDILFDAHFCKKNVNFSVFKSSHSLTPHSCSPLCVCAAYHCNLKCLLMNHEMSLFTRYSLTILLLQSLFYSLSRSHVVIKEINTKIMRIYIEREENISLLHEGRRKINKRYIFHSSMTRAKCGAATASTFSYFPHKYSNPNVTMSINVNISHLWSLLVGQWLIAAVMCQLVFRERLDLF